ncbi:MAG TPA: outer membrane beta-barrel protein [Cellvibrionaceae bacterium]
MPNPKAHVLSLALAGLMTAHTASADFYINANVGMSSFDEDGFDNAVSYNLFAGYQFGKHIAIQAGYVYLGSFEAESSILDQIGGDPDIIVDKADLSITGPELSIVGILPFSDRFSGYAKAGLFHWESDVSVSVSGFGQTASASEKDDEVDSLLGLGVEFAVTPKLSFNADVTRYDALETDITYAGAGVKFRF